MQKIIKSLVPFMGAAIVLTGCAVNQNISPEQRALICQNLRTDIISNDAFTVTSASSPSPMQGYSPNRKTELYSKYDQYQCKT